VTDVRVWGRNGSDIISVDSAFTGMTMLDGGDGADMIDGGNGADLIFGGGGIDLLFGNGGNDMVIGGDGTDILSGGAGHDVLVAGRVAPQFSIAMLRDIAGAWAADRTADEGEDDGTLDESAVDQTLDLLVGGAGADWFIINVGDLLIDYRPNGVNGDLITYI
jgi:Ca2+-binding RTX toxin-like protein